MLEIQDEILIGMDFRGRDIAILKTCKKLTPAGRQLVKVNKFYRNNERKFIDEDLLKIKGVY